MSDHMREQFEDTFSSQGEWPQAIKKDARGGYKFATAATAWETWQSAWEAGQEMMKGRAKELEAINLGLTKTLVEMDAEKAKLAEALEEALHHVVISPDPVRGDFIQEIEAALATHRKNNESTHDNQ